MMSAAAQPHRRLIVANGFRVRPPVRDDDDRSRASAAGAEAPRVAIFVYHRFVATTTDELAVRVTTFEMHVGWLREQGFSVVPLRDIVAWRCDPDAPIPPKAVALTVDDGHVSVRDVLAPIVLRERLPVTLFVHPPAVASSQQGLGWDDLRKLYRTALFDVQPSMWWYPEFAAAERMRSPDAFRAFVQRHLDNARTQLRRHLRSNADLLAWAPGLCDDELIELARQSGYAAGFTLGARRVTHDTRTFALPRYPMIERCTPAMLGRLLGGTTATV
jgi:hypothetical protein